tara:strand:+ start:198 stop:545 length:348 start_codon:yes stop_codon:yes gene_type:complete
MSDFKETNTFEKRQNESKRIRSKHPDRIPIIVNKCKGDRLPDIDKQKYLVPNEMSIGQFMYIIRKRIKLDPNQALFVMVNKTLQSSSRSVVDIYEDCCDDDGFLYLTYSSENTFG